MTAPSAIPPEKTPAKVSSAELFKRLDSLAEVVKQHHRLGLNPEAMYVYKPMKAGSGTALKVDLRLDPVYGDTGYVTEVKGGLFVELAAQEGVKDGFPTFGWKSESKVSAKLGIPDVTALLLGLREVRMRGKPVPVGIRPKGDDKGATISLFHRFGDKTAAISLQFIADGSFFGISKSKDLRRGIKLTLSEEIALETYLRLALKKLLQLGVR